MEEIMTNHSIRYDLTDEDMKFFAPKHKQKKVIGAKHVARHIAKMKQRQK